MTRVYASFNYAHMLDARKLVEPGLCSGIYTYLAS